MPYLLITGPDHEALTDPWCDASLCDHPTIVLPTKETTMYRLTDAILDKTADVESWQIIDTLTQWLPEPTDTMIRTMHSLVGKLNAGGDGIAGECAYLGIYVDQL